MLELFNLSCISVSILKPLIFLRAPLSLLMVRLGLIVRSLVRVTGLPKLLLSITSVNNFGECLFELVQVFAIIVLDLIIMNICYDLALIFLENLLYLLVAHHFLLFGLKLLLQLIQFVLMVDATIVLSLLHLGFDLDFLSLDFAALIVKLSFELFEVIALFVHLLNSFVVALVELTG